VKKANKMKTFVVTGASGYIGSHMCYELRQSYPDCKIIGIDKVQKHKLNHLYDDFFTMDLAKSNFHVFERERPDCIFHFAALTLVPQGEQNPYSYYYNNTMSLIKVLDEALYAGVKNFIFSSTCAVYGPVRLPVSENLLMNPKSVYAKSKVICEEILQAAEKQHGIRAAILRYFNAAGRSVEADLYEEHDPETHLIPNIMKDYKLDVYGKTFDTPDGTAIRDYIHVTDICKSHIKAYEYMEKNKKGIVCNIGTGKGHSVLDVVKTVEQVTGRTVELFWNDIRPGDVACLVSDVDRMKNVLTFTPEHDMVSIIKSMRN
jgi:UDP-glucose-4-epimerase GalE